MCEKKGSKNIPWEKDEVPSLVVPGIEVAGDTG
jgi:hypothetical protein